MIFSSLADMDKLAGLHPGFAKAFDFLRSNDLALLELRKYEIDGDDVFAMVQEHNGKPRDEALLEAHKRYIDIQFVVSGYEEIGCALTDSCTPDSAGWDDAMDLCFFEERPDFWLPVSEGHFVILYPNDIHAPNAGNTATRKIVIKVAV